MSDKNKLSIKLTPEMQLKLQSKIEEVLKNGLVQRPKPILKRRKITPA